MSSEKPPEIHAIEQLIRETAEHLSAIAGLLEVLIASHSDLVDVVEGLAAEVELLHSAPSDATGEGDGRRALRAQAEQARDHAAELGRQSQAMIWRSEELRLSRGSVRRDSSG